MALSTRLTERFDLRHPVISAPMAVASGGALAGAVSAAGGLGLIGGAYGDAGWLEEQFRAAGNQGVGCGFITWSLRKAPHLLEAVLARKPRAVFLSFDDPAPFASRIRAAGVRLICQVQTIKDAARALDVGADVVVAQGAEAGGHGERRSTLTLVPEVADLIAARSPGTLLCGAGGIADGRGLAAVLMLGADGAVIGSRFWASSEALVHPNMHRSALAANGDATVRSSVMDIVRELDWPERFTARVLRNPFIERWHGHEGELRERVAEEAGPWRRAWDEGDVSIANTFIGEAVGLIHAIEPAAAILSRIVEEAEAAIRNRARSLGSR
jgi:nitronate monooxygenase